MPSDRFASEPGFVRLEGGRQNNLRNIDVSFPQAALTVVTGVSGSGKSSLAFDTVYAEGQRRYVECVSTYAKHYLDRLPRPDYDRLDGLAPALAIRQGAPPQTGRSTVGTVTEIADYLRLLLARVGQIRCGACGTAVPRHSLDTILADILAGPNEEVMVMVRREPESGGGVRETLRHALARGFVRARVGDDPTWLRLDDEATLRGEGAVDLLVDRIAAAPDNRMRIREALELARREGEGKIDVAWASGDRRRYQDGRICPRCARSFPEPRPQLFSFNSPYGACPDCKGFGDILTFSVDRIVPDPGKTVLEGALDPWAKSWRAHFLPKLKRLSAEMGVSLTKPFRDLSKEHQRILLHGAPGYRGVIPFLERQRAKAYKSSARFLVKRYQESVRCHSCHGTRLKAEAMEVEIGDRNIRDLLAMTVAELRSHLTELALEPVRAAVAAPILSELRGRLEYLGETGLDYLTLDRSSRTLSGGEAQRIELANALGGCLSHALYVLDEPTVGLHPRDTERLIGVLQRLKHRGNTILVVEHDADVMAAADWIVELGPGAGHRGGSVLYQGPAPGWPGRATAIGGGGTDRLREDALRSRPGKGAWIEIRGAREHNLKDISVRFPPGRMSGVCGVSGSGKSTLVEEILWRVAARGLGEGAPPPGAHRAVRGLQRFDRVALVDQAPVSRSQRSNPATYVKAFDRIRERFARAPLAVERGYTPGTFSFNVPGGRCETCEGAGVIRVEMYFLADLWVPCDACGGRRYRNEVLAVEVHGHSIHDVLERTVEEALALFTGEVEVQQSLWILERVGLGYLRLGQPLTTLSGGETQRLKLARELSARSAGASLYILDEPTVGLHRADIEVLLRVLRELMRRGATIVAVEHNLDFLRACDWLIELGPEGGEAGGYLVAEGTPAELAGDGASLTGSYLKRTAAWA